MSVFQYIEMAAGALSVLLIGLFFDLGSESYSAGVIVTGFLMLVQMKRKAKLDANERSTRGEMFASGLSLFMKILLLYGVMRFVYGPVEPCGGGGYCGKQNHHYSEIDYRAFQSWIMAMVCFWPAGFVILMILERRGKGSVKTAPLFGIRGFRSYSSRSLVDADESSSKSEAFLGSTRNSHPSP